MKLALSNTLFYRNLRYLRQKYALSRRAACRLLGLNPAELTRMENETYGSVVEYCIVRRICQVFDVTTADLAGRDLSDPEDVISPADAAEAEAYLRKLECAARLLRE